MRRQGRSLLVTVVILAVTGLAATVSVLSVNGGGEKVVSADPPRTPVSTPGPTATVTRSPTAPPATPTAVVRYGILDGMPMTEADWRAKSQLAPLAVMIDNAPPALPQYGISKADVVYEALVEGGLTRFMAVYWRQEAARVEPIRSARTPFVVWASELGAFYAHAGGAETANEANAIGQIHEWGVAALDGLVLATSAGFSRDSARGAPYNLKADTEALRESAMALGYTQSLPAPWRFKDDFVGTRSSPIVQALELSVAPDRSRDRIVQWRWDPLSNTYLRFQWGSPHVDESTGDQTRFKTIVVMRVPWRVVDGGGHVLLSLIGEGAATVFQDGRAVEARWRKTSREARTRFYDASGVEAAFNRGPVFIEVIGPEGHVLTATSADGLPALPAPPARATPTEPAAPASATATSPSSGTPLPSPSSGTPLPSPSSGTPLPSPSSGTPLPSPSSGTPLPSPSSGTTLPSPSSTPPPPSPGSARP